jgi:hypothetical protein
MNSLHLPTTDNNVLLLLKLFFCLPELARSPALGYTKFTPAETRVECRVGIELGHAVQQAGVLNFEQRRTLI